MMHLVETIKEVVLVPIHPKGLPIIWVASMLALILFAFSSYAGLAGVVLCIFCVYFFRNPDRMVPQAEGIVLASGDGVISHIAQAPLPEELGEDDTMYHKVSIFLNVFNVHVNRVPAGGTILKHVYIPGKFINAALDKASKDNERTVSLLQTPQGQKIGFAQIAGFVARRIIHELAPQQRIAQGERYGIIRFGSRCDLYIPLHYQLLADVGSTCVGGETLIASDPALYQPETLQWKKI
jgi:phosphatidylserine decarboxylase